MLAPGMDRPVERAPVQQVDVLERRLQQRDGLVADRKFKPPLQGTRLRGTVPVQPVAGVFVGDIPERVAAIAARLNSALQAGGERARDGLRAALGDGISLTPDASGRFLWADYSLGLLPLFPGAEGKADLMVAGVGFEPTTFGL